MSNPPVLVLIQVLNESPASVFSLPICLTEGASHDLSQQFNHLSVDRCASRKHPLDPSSESLPDLVDDWTLRLYQFESVFFSSKRFNDALKHAIVQPWH